MMDLLDNQNDLQKVHFVALNLERLPRFGPEETNFCALADKQAQLDNKVDDLSNQVLSLSNLDICSVVLQRVDDQLALMTSKVDEQVNLFAASCSRAATSASVRASNPGTVTSASNAAPPVDRSRNVIVTGVEESRTSDDWRDVVSRVLATASGRVVDIDDAFRLGRFVSGKCRPILVKLKSVWDRRLTLNGSYKLNNHAQFSRVFINADEPLESRRQTILKRLKKKAFDRGQEVSVSSDGVLSISGNVVFSLQDGFVRRVSAVTSVDG